MNAVLDAWDKSKKVLKEVAEIEDDPNLPPKAPCTSTNGRDYAAANC